MGAFQAVHAAIFGRLHRLLLPAGDGRQRLGRGLGDFKGRVAALGGTVGYNFEMGETPVSLRLKEYQEFAAKNRMEGTAGFVTVSFPIGTPPKQVD